MRWQSVSSHRTPCFAKRFLIAFHENQISLQSFIHLIVCSLAKYILTELLLRSIQAAWQAPNKANTENSHSALTSHQPGRVQRNQTLRLGTQTQKMPASEGKGEGSSDPRRRRAEVAHWVRVARVEFILCGEEALKGHFGGRQSPGSGGRQVTRREQRGPWRAAWAADPGPGLRGSQRQTGGRPLGHTPGC